MQGFAREVSMSHVKAMRGIAVVLGRSYRQLLSGQARVSKEHLEMGKNNHEIFYLTNFLKSNFLRTKGLHWV